MLAPVATASSRRSRQRSGSIRHRDVEHVTLKELGHALRALRLDKDISLEEVAQAMHCSRVALDKIEIGKLKTVSPLFWRYCTFLGVDVIFDIDDAAYQRGINKMRFTKRGGTS